MDTLIDTLTRSALAVGVAVVALVVLVGVFRYLAYRVASRVRPENRKRGRVLVWGAALGASTVLAVVVVLTQIPFYEALFGGHATPLPSLPWLNLVYLTPVALESLAWVFTVMSVFAVVNDKPSGRYERLMWVLSSVAGVVNAGHNISNGQAVTGLVLGGFSIAGPLLVHYALRWDRDAQSDWNADKFRQVAIERAVFVARRSAQIMRHPRHSWQAMSYATDLGCSWDAAYRIALTGQYDAVHAVLVDQIRRSMPAVHTVPVEDRRSLLGRVVRRAPRPRTEVVHDAIEGVRDNADEPVHGGVHDDEVERAHGPIGADEFPVCTDPIVHDLGLLDDPRALFARLDELSGVHGDRARQESSDDDRARGSAHDGVHGSEGDDARRADDAVHGVHDECARGAQDGVHGSGARRARGGAQGRARSKSKRARQGDAPRAREVVHGHVERQDDTAARFYLAARRRGIDISALTRAQVVERIGISNTTAVSRGFAKAESGEFVDPGEQPDEHEWFGGDQ